MMPPISRIEYNAFMEWRRHEIRSFPFTETSRRQHLLDILQSSFAPMKPMLESNIRPSTPVMLATPSSVFHVNQMQAKMRRVLAADASSLLRSFSSLSTLGDDALLLSSLDSWVQLVRFSTQFLCLCAFLHNDWSGIESLKTSFSFPPTPSIQRMGVPQRNPAPLPTTSHREMLLNVLESTYLYVQNASEEELKESELLLHYGELVRSCCSVYKKKEVKEKPSEEEEEETGETVPVQKEEREEDVEYVYQGVAAKQKAEEKDRSGGVGVMMHHKELMEELKVFHASRQRKTKRVVVGDAFEEEEEEEETPVVHVSLSPVSFFSLLSRRGEESVIE